MGEELDNGSGITDGQGDVLDSFQNDTAPDDVSVEQPDDETIDDKGEEEEYLSWEDAEKELETQLLGKLGGNFKSIEDVSKTILEAQRKITELAQELSNYKNGGQQRTESDDSKATTDNSDILETLLDNPKEFLDSYFEQKIAEMNQKNEQAKAAEVAAEQVRCNMLTSIADEIGITDAKQFDDAERAKISELLNSEEGQNIVNLINAENLAKYGESEIRRAVQGEIKKLAYYARGILAREQTQKAVETERKRVIVSRKTSGVSSSGGRSSGTGSKNQSATSLNDFMSRL